MDRKMTRALAAEAVHHSIDHRRQHELWRVCNTFKGGLTDKELRYAHRMLERMTELNQQLQKLRDRLQHGERNARLK